MREGCGLRAEAGCGRDREVLRPQGHARAQVWHVVRAIAEALKECSTRTVWYSSTVLTLHSACGSPIASNGATGCTCIQTYTRPGIKRPHLCSKSSTAHSAREVASLTPPTDARPAAAAPPAPVAPAADASARAPVPSPMTSRTMAARTARCSPVTSRVGWYAPTSCNMTAGGHGTARHCRCWVTVRACEFPCQARRSYRYPRKPIESTLAGPDYANKHKSWVLSY